jgi:DNA-directed RNA polymerase subunit RPC12/RpoP
MGAGDYTLVECSRCGHKFNAPKEQTPPYICFGCGLDALPKERREAFFNGTFLQSFRKRHRRRTHHRRKRS